MLFNASFNGNSHVIHIVENQKGYLVSIDDQKPFHIDLVDRVTGGYTILHDGKSYDFEVENKETEYAVLSRGHLFLVDLINPKALTAKTKDIGEQKIVARMPGKIIKILTQVGDVVKKGQGLIIMEAMKMENELKAPTSGKVKSISVQVGATVETGTDLLHLESSST
ncbi:MAG: acetyl-CoA carboxylase biotin carboxyl carrier protein subunit [Deltaproteobacteria bacterium]|nr:acetyl-CoA carboxylase biotin carboxyl carrier protein subunit [Deltaproteobacteria bacterium]